MRKWTAEQWCLFILSVTIPMIILAVSFARAITGTPISPEGAKLLDDVLNSLITGILAILAYKIGSKNKNDDNSNPIKEN